MKLALYLASDSFIQGFFMFILILSKPFKITRKNIYNTHVIHKFRLIAKEKFLKCF